MGVEAVVALMEATSNTEPCVICTEGTQLIRQPLMDCINRTIDVGKVNFIYLVLLKHACCVCNSVIQ